MEYHTEDGGRRWGTGSIAQLNIAKNPEWSTRYALEVLKGRFQLGEEGIIHSPDSKYARAYDEGLGTDLLSQWQKINGGSDV